MRFGKAGDGIDQKQHMFAKVAEMLGHGHRREEAAFAHQRGLIRGCSHDDRARHPLRPKHLIGEFPELATAFAHQRDHCHIRLHPAREPRHERGFSDAGAREKPDPLPPDQWQQRIEHRYPGREPRAKAAPIRGVGRAGDHRPSLWPRQQGASVQRPAQRVDDPAQPGGIGGKAGLSDQLDPAADGKAAGLAFGQDQGA